MGRLTVSLEDVQRAAETIADTVAATPIVRLPPAEGPGEVWLKLEMLQPLGSMKLRGVLNAVRNAPPRETALGLVTTSSGNLGRAVAWTARSLGLSATVAVPDHAPATKIAAIEALGAHVVRLPYDRWWDAMTSSHVENAIGFFVHPVLDRHVIAGNATIALELADQMEPADAVLVPFGGGALALGMATTLAAVWPATRVIACEPVTGAALAASFAQRQPVSVPLQRSFVDAAGSPSVLSEVWESVSGLLAEARAVELSSVAAAIRLVAKDACVIAEGAGALPVAAAIEDRGRLGRAVCVVTGGNISPSKLAQVLNGATPDVGS